MTSVRSQLPTYLLLPCFDDLEFKVQKHKKDKKQNKTGIIHLLVLLVGSSNFIHLWHLKNHTKGDCNFSSMLK